MSHKSEVRSKNRS